MLLSYVTYFVKKINIKGKEGRTKGEKLFNYFM